MSVPPPTRTASRIRESLWRPLAAFRLLGLVYAIALAVHRRSHYSAPLLTVAVLTAMVAWTLVAAVGQPRSDGNGRPRTLAALVGLDLALGAGFILCTRVHGH